MATVTITVPDPNMVTVWGYIVYPDNKPVVASKVLVKVDPSPQAFNNSLLDRTEYTTKTDETGYFEFQLIGGLNVTIINLDSNFKRSGTLPTYGFLEATKLGMTNP